MSEIERETRILTFWTLATTEFQEGTILWGVGKVQGCYRPQRVAVEVGGMGGVVTTPGQCSPWWAGAWRSTPWWELSPRSLHRERAGTGSLTSPAAFDLLLVVSRWPNPPQPAREPAWWGSYRSASQRRGQGREGWKMDLGVNRTFGMTILRPVVE